MKIIATVAAGLIAAANAQAATTTAAAGPVYVESMVQTKTLLADGIPHGIFSWKTRAVAGSPELAEVVYTLRALNNNNSNFLSTGMNDKSVEMQAGVVSPKADPAKNITGLDRADYCRFRVQMKEAPEAPWKFVVQDTKDGRLDGWAGRGANDKWNFDNDADDRQNCRFVAETFFVANFNKTTQSIQPTFTWTKLLTPKDDTQDVPMRWNQSLPVYWRFKVADLERRGFFEGLFLDDPLNPTMVKASAKSLMAGMISSAALVYATLA
jgi:hypothetical protein